MRLSAVVLAGGRSARMGRDKAMLAVPGYESLLARQLAFAGSTRPVEILVSCRPEQHLRVPTGVRRVHDHGFDGPLGGVIASLQAARGDALLVLGVDLAAMTCHMLRRIVADGLADGSSGSIPRSARGVEPLAAVFPKTVLQLAEVQRSQAADLSLRTLARTAVAAGLARWFEIAAPELPAFANWNSRLDIAETGRSYSGAWLRAQS